MRVSEIERRYRKRLLLRFADPDTLSGEERLQALMRQAEDVLETASHRARRMAAHAEREARLIAQQAEEEARQRGRARGLTEAARETAARRRECELVLEEVRLLRRDLVDAARREAVEMARSLALQVLGLPPETCPEAWEEAFRRFLDQEPADARGRPLVLECHPDLEGCLRSLEPVIRGRVRLDVDARVPRRRLRLFGPTGVVEHDPARSLAEVGEAMAEAAGAGEDPDPSLADGQVGA